MVAIGGTFYLYYSATEDWDDSPFGRHAIHTAYADMKRRVQAESSGGR